jgi:hypothetical protein
MPLALINVVGATSEGVPVLYGNFVTDIPGSVEPEIMALLTEREKGRICFLLGITAFPMTGISANTDFQLFPVAPFEPDYSGRRPDFTTANGYRVWINRRE